MNEPTQEQIKKFWEWCGFTEFEGNYCLWPEDKGTGRFNYIPDIDLNNLFKYAVPKLQDKGEVISLIAYECSGFTCRIACVFTTTGAHTISENGNPALALFWAIYKVIEGGNNES